MSPPIIGGAGAREADMTDDEARAMEPGTVIKATDEARQRGVIVNHVGAGANGRFVKFTRGGWITVIRDGNKATSTYHPAFWDRA